MLFQTHEKHHTSPALRELQYLQQSYRFNANQGKILRDAFKEMCDVMDMAEHVSLGNMNEFRPKMVQCRVQAFLRAKSKRMEAVMLSLRIKLRYCLVSDAVIDRLLGELSMIARGEIAQDV